MADHPVNASPPPASTDELRARAEQLVGQIERSPGGADGSELRRLIRELAIHQIELELQNEELLRAQTELQASQSQYFDLYHQAPVGYLTISIQTNILDCNETCADLLGLPRTALLNRRLVQFVSPDARSTFQATWDRLLATGSTEDLELPLVRPDAGRFWGRLRLRPGTDRDHEMRVGRVTLVDATERMQMQERSARLAALVDSAPHAIVSCTTWGEISSWNGGAERLFGYSAADVIGRGMGALYPIGRLQEEAENRNRLLRGEIVASEIELVRKDGALVPVLATWSAVLDRRRRALGISFLGVDIREQVETRRRLGATLAELAERERALREADRRKDDFIATLAHELRNPLAPIRNAAAVLRHSSNLDRSGAWARDVIDRQVGHMAALLEDLLDVSRITRDTISLKLERVELGAMIEQAIEITRPQLDARRHELVVTMPPHPIQLEGDPTRLIQIFDNLLSNAAKYTDPGGRISVDTSLVDGTAVVRVADTGIGIQADQLPRIFELFSQVVTAIDRAQGGLGIGLALVRGLVRKHGGTIEATSAGPGKGSEFIVRLPGAVIGTTAESTRVSGPAVSVDAPPTPPLILVVDDNLDAADSMAMMLRLSGYEVITANTGEDAIAIAAARRPYAIFLDLGMPGLNGYEVARRIRSEPWGRGIVLTACTGWGQTEDRRRTQEAGFDHHLVKPGSLQAILEILSSDHPEHQDAIGS